MKKSNGKRKRAIELYLQNKYTISEIANISKLNCSTVEFLIKQYNSRKISKKASNKMISRKVTTRQNGYSNWIDSIIKKSATASCNI